MKRKQNKHGYVEKIVNVNELDYSKSIDQLAQDFEIPHMTLRRFLKKKGVYDKFKTTNQGGTCWNKGLTKETSEIVAQCGRTYSEGIKSGRIKPSQLGKPLSKKHKEKISDTISKKVEEGTWHYSFSKVRTHEHESPSAGKIKVHGSWELAFAKYLDSKNIKWCRPKEKFRYEYEGLKKGYGYYIPDFYLIDKDYYIEIKGYETAKDRAKWKWFPHKLKILKGKSLKEKFNLDIEI